MQSYGGEAAIRSFLYASPILAPLAALVVVRLLDDGVGTGRGYWTRLVAAVVVFFTLGVWVVTDRGLNTSFEHTTPEEAAVALQIMDQVGNANLAFWGQGSLYGLAKPFELGPECLTGSEALADCAAAETTKYVIDSDQDEKYLQYQSGVSPDVVRRAVAILQSDKGFTMMYDGRHLRVLKRVDAPTLKLGVGR